MVFPGISSQPFAWLWGLQNSFCSFAISLALLSNSARSVWFYFCIETVCCFLVGFCMFFYFCVLSLLFLLFKYAAVFSMTTTLTTATTSEGPGPSFWPGSTDFSNCQYFIYFLRLPGHFLHLHPLPLSLSLFVSDPLSQTLARMCVCFPVCLRLFLAFMELIKTSLCSFGKKRKKKIKIKKGEPKSMFNVVFGPKT